MNEENYKTPYRTVPYRTLSHRDMRTAAATQRKAHDLSFGKYEEHDESLDADGDNDDDSYAGELFPLLRGRRCRRQRGRVTQLHFFYFTDKSVAKVCKKNYWVPKR